MTKFLSVSGLLFDAVLSCASFTENCNPFGSSDWACVGSVCIAFQLAIQLGPPVAAAMMKAPQVLTIDLGSG
jgi:hypothetical protein